MRSKHRFRRRRERQQDDAPPIHEILKIIELLATKPTGLTVPEIVGRIGKPAPRVVRTLAIMQRRQLLRTDGSGLSRRRSYI